MHGIDLPKHDQHESPMDNSCASRVQTPAPKPVSLAISKASSVVLKVVTAKTGPKFFLKILFLL